MQVYIPITSYNNNHNSILQVTICRRIGPIGLYARVRPQQETENEKEHIAQQPKSNGQNRNTL